MYLCLWSEISLFFIWIYFEADMLQCVYDVIGNAPKLARFQKINWLYSSIKLHFSYFFCEFNMW